MHKLIPLLLVVMLMGGCSLFSKNLKEYPPTTPAEVYIYESKLYTYRIDAIILAVESGLIPEQVYAQKIYPTIEIGNTWLDALERIIKSQSLGQYVDEKSKEVILSGVQDFSNLLERKQNEAFQAQIKELLQ